ncbi:hypothetical protein [Sphingomonas yabuuchiae]|uniref:Uncharacterized protein n=1 Tax=Sphingomonas yabuuchiae TaxID=172044 RepID=A0AA40ZZ85_9SPHN|nr:hypothetical protein [Sphingomonas yabuuchiae]MBN3557093.1 hypothetical protein [Sphingomonas yabuuchiae]
MPRAAGSIGTPASVTLRPASASSRGSRLAPFTPVTLPVVANSVSGSGRMARWLWSTGSCRRCETLKVRRRGPSIRAEVTSLYRVPPPPSVVMPGRRWTVTARNFFLVMKFITRILGG